MISVVIPVYRDTAALARTLAESDFAGTDVIVVSTERSARLQPSVQTDDRGRADVRRDGAGPAVDDEMERDGFSRATLANPGIRWISAERGRAPQMNAGAAMARGEWILFLHADTRLPSAWRDAIDEARRDPRVAIGCFQFRLDSASRFARAIEWGVRLRVGLFGLPYGDQALFIRRDLFEELGGYSDLPIMEDVDLVRRARARGRLFRSHLPVVTSARRWETDGWIGRTARHLALILLYFCGVEPRTLVRLDRARRSHPDAPGRRNSL